MSKDTHFSYIFMVDIFSNTPPGRVDSKTLTMCVTMKPASRWYFDVHSSLQYYTIKLLDDNRKHTGGRTKRKSLSLSTATGDHTFL